MLPVPDIKLSRALGLSPTLGSRPLSSGPLGYSETLAEGIRADRHKQDSLIKALLEIRNGDTKEHAESKQRAGSISSVFVRYFPPIPVSTAIIVQRSRWSTISKCWNSIAAQSVPELLTRLPTRRDNSTAVKPSAVKQEGIRSTSYDTLIYQSVNR
ncbi:hypothetical protein RRG08_022299 [Elysia crispata]|uniref:Uncharacterized protein n=1 Tax=Elysia crispata TaxID=231223 RepID=A0AAE0ZQJ1_9GAST|nr:hypothetical protein RRG08_022299 [Elysia crispata]